MPSLPCILIATHNAHKVEEFQQLLGDAFTVESLPKESTPPEENGESFEENAKLKAELASRLFDAWILADDSGLEVDALNGEPGIYSARYAGPGATGAANRGKLLTQLHPLGEQMEKRRGRFRCVIAIARRGELLATFSGAVEGTIGNSERGDGGFGYDSLFIPIGYHQTFAELSSEVKHKLSHRGNAARQAVEWLKKNIESS